MATTRHEVAYAGKRLTTVDPARRSLMFYNATDVYVYVAPSVVPSSSEMMCRLGPHDVCIVPLPLVLSDFYASSAVAEETGIVYVTEGF